MKTIITAVVLLLTLCTIADGSAHGEWALERIGVAFNTAGLNDMAFNRPVHEGILQAAMQNDLKVTTKVASYDGDEENILRELIELDCDLIVGVGFPMVEPLNQVASEHKTRRFLLIDAALDLPNVISMVFREQEGSFLAGALAARLTSSGVIGFIGGADVEVINRFNSGFVQGATWENQYNVRVLSDYVGEGVPAFTSPAKATIIARDMIDGGADVLFHAAGYSGLGVIRAAQEAGILAIGVDYDQSFLAPGIVVGSLVKRIRPATADVIRRLARNMPVPDMVSLGLAERSLEITGLDKTDALPPGTRAHLLLLERKISDRSLTIE